MRNKVTKEQRRRDELVEPYFEKADERSRKAGSKPGRAKDEQLEKAWTKIGKNADEKTARWLWWD